MSDIFSKHALDFRLSEYWNESKSFSLTITSIFYKRHKTSPHNPRFIVNMIDIVIKYSMPFSHWKHILILVFKK